MAMTNQENAYSSESPIEAVLVDVVLKTDFAVTGGGCCSRWSPLPPAGVSGTELHS